MGNRKTTWPLDHWVQMRNCDSITATVSQAPNRRARRGNSDRGTIAMPTRRRPSFDRSLYGKTREGVSSRVFFKVAASWAPTPTTKTCRWGPRGRVDLNVVASGYSISGFALTATANGVFQVLLPINECGARFGVIRTAARPVGRPASPALQGHSRPPMPQPQVPP